MYLYSSCLFRRVLDEYLTLSKWERLPGVRCCDWAGEKKVNTVDECYLVGYSDDRHAEFIRRPIIVSALELCTPQVVDLLLNFAADLAKYHEGRYPYFPKKKHTPWVHGGLGPNFST